MTKQQERRHNLNNPADVDNYDLAQVPVGQIFDLALIKVLSTSTPGPFSPGSTVTFDIVVYNQRDIDAYNVNVNDYIPEGG
ncbi:MAG: hypothetical protein R2766_02660 [Saprospiraceae bacterium]